MYIDPHVHCRDGSQAYKETVKHALEVAERAGVDAIFDMPNTDPPITTRSQVVERLSLAASCNSKVFYGLYIGVTSNPTQLKEAVKIYNDLFPKQGSRVGVVGMKMFAGKSVGDLGVLDLTSQEIVYKTLAESNYEGIFITHCEKESEMKPELWNPKNPITHCRARPSISELASIQDQISLALKTGFKGKLHITHISSPTSVEYINLIKKYYPSLKITCGTTPHHLFYYDEMMNLENGLLLKMNPPLRTKKEQEAMLELLKKGMIDCIETDHAPHTLQEKLNSPYMSGVPWLNQWPVFVEWLRKQGLSESQIQDLTFNNAKKIFDIDIYQSQNPGKYFPAYESEYHKKPSMKTTIAEISFNHPIFNAAGPLCVTLDELKAIGESKSSAITTKSCTLEFREGNPEPRYKDLPLGSINSMGLPNLGYKRYVEFMPILKSYNKPVIASVSGLKLEDNIEIVKAFNNTDVDLIELNLSCPNIPGKPQVGYDFEQTDQVLTEIMKITKKPLGVKLPPYFDFVHYEQMAVLLNKHKVRFVACINSLGNTLFIDPEKEMPVIKPKGGFGGLGGSYVKPVALANVRKFYELLDKDIDIIGVGGINSGMDVFEFILAGAKAVQLATVFAQEGHSCFSRIEKEFNEIMQRKGYNSIEEIRGKLKEM